MCSPERARPSDFIRHASAGFVLRRPVLHKAASRRIRGGSVQRARAIPRDCGHTSAPRVRLHLCVRGRRPSRGGADRYRIHLGLRQRQRSITRQRTSIQTRHDLPHQPRRHDRIRRSLRSVHSTQSFASWLSSSLVHSVIDVPEQVMRLPSRDVDGQKSGSAGKLLDFQVGMRVYPSGVSTNYKINEAATRSGCTPPYCGTTRKSASCRA